MSTHFNTKHGHRTTEYTSPTYKSWCAMIARCYRKKARDYQRYGGRGIKICDAWRQSFVNFLGDMGQRPQGTTLDRINVNGDYLPENCRWATIKEQNNNRRDNHLLTYDGKTQTVADWERELGFKNNTVYFRLRRGWSIEDALSKPLQNTQQKKICKYGHAITRDVNGHSICKECRRKNALRFYYRHREKCLHLNRHWRQTARPKLAAYKRTQREKRKMQEENQP